MLVEQIWTGNAYRNFNYLIACPSTGEAIAIDPLEYKMCFDKAKSNGWNIKYIINTHEHGDHTGGNLALSKLTKVEILAHYGASGKIPGMTKSLKEGDLIKVGKEIELLVLDTPGHTMTHICLLSMEDNPVIFSGDTIFNAGAGNCHHGGHPEELYNTFKNKFINVKPETIIYPGHDYLEANLNFTINREPNNQDAIKMLEKIKGIKNPGEVKTTLAIEEKINTFFRLSNKDIIEKLCVDFPTMSSNPSPKEVFLNLRQLRNNW